MSEIIGAKEKYLFVDLLRGIAILAVVFGHIASPLSGFIYSWHIPLFFFLSGFFIMPSESVKVFLSKNFKKIMLYFFVFAILGFAATYFRNIFIGKTNETIAAGLAGIFFFMDLEHLKHYGFVLWFLPALFWGKAINYFFLKYIKNIYLTGILIALLFCLALSLKIRLPFALDIGLLASLWIFFGYLAFKFKERIFSQANYILPASLVCWLLLPIPGLDLATRFLSRPFYNVVFSSMIIVFLFVAVERFSRKIETGNLLAYLGQNTMFLFVFHAYTNNIAYLVAFKWFDNSWPIKFVLSFVFIYLALVITRKYLNKTILKYV